MTGAVASQNVTDARRFAQAVWKSAIECKSISELDCETYKSSRWETSHDRVSDPVVLYGKAIAQRIKGTPGITGL